MKKPRRPVIGLLVSVVLLFCLISGCSDATDASSDTTNTPAKQYSIGRHSCAQLGDCVVVSGACTVLQVPQFTEIPLDFFLSG